MFSKSVKKQLFCDESHNCAGEKCSGHSVDAIRQAVCNIPTWFEDLFDSPVSKKQLVTFEIINFNSLLSCVEGLFICCNVVTLLFDIFMCIFVLLIIT